MATAGGARGSGPERAFAPELPATGAVTLDAEESSHLVRSRRVRVGEAVVLFDGRGTTRIGSLRKADGRAAVVEVEGDYPARAPARRVRLAVSLPEAGRADRLVGALAELGVETLAPLVCERTPPGRGDLAARRTQRWERLAREAAKVNGAARVLAFHSPLAFAEALREVAVLLDPDPGLPPLLDVVPARGPPWILIGPEGGFSGAELAAARAAGCAAARLGNLVLRTETAAVAAAAILSS